MSKIKSIPTLQNPSAAPIALPWAQGYERSIDSQSSSPEMGQPQSMVAAHAMKKRAIASVADAPVTIIISGDINSLLKKLSSIIREKWTEENRDLSYQILKQIQICYNDDDIDIEMFAKTLLAMMDELKTARRGSKIKFIGCFCSEILSKISSPKVVVNTIRKIDELHRNLWEDLQVIFQIIKSGNEIYLKLPVDALLQMFLLAIPDSSINPYKDFEFMDSVLSFIIQRDPSFHKHLAPVLERTFKCFHETINNERCFKKELDFFQKILNFLTKEEKETISVFSMETFKLYFGADIRAIGCYSQIRSGLLSVIQELPQKNKEDFCLFISKILMNRTSNFGYISFDDAGSFIEENAPALVQCPQMLSAGIAHFLIPFFEAKMYKGILEDSVFTSTLFNAIVFLLKNANEEDQLTIIQSLSRHFREILKDTRSSEPALIKSLLEMFKSTFDAVKMKNRPVFQELFSQFIRPKLFCILPFIRDEEEGSALVFAANEILNIMTEQFSEMNSFGDFRCSADIYLDSPQNFGRDDLLYPNFDHKGPMEVKAKNIFFFMYQSLFINSPVLIDVAAFILPQLFRKLITSITSVDQINMLAENPYMAKLIQFLSSHKNPRIVSLTDHVLQMVIGKIRSVLDHQGDHTILQHLQAIKTLSLFAAHPCSALFHAIDDLMHDLPLDIFAQLPQKMQKSFIDFLTSTWKDIEKAPRSIREFLERTLHPHSDNKK